MVAVPPPTTEIYRVGRRPGDPFAPPPWEYAGQDGTFGNRFDDPGPRPPHLLTERFRVIYCASSPEGAFGETLAPLRPKLSLLSRLRAIDDDEPFARLVEGLIDPEHPTRGIVSADWQSRRQLGRTTLDSSLRFVDLTTAETLQHLRSVLAPVAARHGLVDVDLSAIGGPHREVTQACARYMDEQRDNFGQPRFAGLRYLSRLDAGWECWAIFHDRMLHKPGFPEPILADNQHLLAVARLLELSVEVLPGRYVRPGV